MSCALCQCEDSDCLCGHVRARKQREADAAASCTDLHCTECGAECSKDPKRVVCNDDTNVCGDCAADMSADELERN